MMEVEVSVVVALVVDVGDILNVAVSIWKDYL